MQITQHTFGWRGVGGIPFTNGTLCNRLHKLTRTRDFQNSERIAPYCGGPFQTREGLLCRTKSFLCVNTVHAKHLKEIGIALTNRAKDLPPCFAIT